MECCGRRTQFTETGHLRSDPLLARAPEPTEGRRLELPIMRRVLSIDGGGIRGLIPAVVCAKFERWSGKPINVLFDLIAGSSTGGILALGLALPPNGKSASDLVDFYLREGPGIFSEPQRTLAQFFRPKFAPANLCRVTTQVFGSCKLSQAIVEVLITAYDVRLRAPMYLSRKSAKENSLEDYFMRDVAVATSAAPTVFPPANLGQHVVIDGGIVANNTALAAYAHAKRLWPEEDIMLVSLGTGTLTPPLKPEETQRWGKFRWVEPPIDCLFDGTSKTTNDFFRHVHLPKYWRFQGGLSKATEGLDVATEAALNGLEQIGHQITVDNEHSIIDLLGQLQEVGARLDAKITKPKNGGLVRPGELTVEGSIANFKGQPVYLFTGANGRYWPSGRLLPKDCSWSGMVHLGFTAADATITLAQVDHLLAEYIEFYAAKAAALGYPGIPISDFPQHFDRVQVALDHRR